MKPRVRIINLFIIMGLLIVLALTALPAGAAPANQTTTDTLTAAEIEGILYMREEEKLARDVYLTLYDVWQYPTFQNIARSETTHMASVKLLIDLYGLEDPASPEIGVFTDPTLQGLYDQLVATGSESLAAGLRVGAAIEEIDILDLQQHLAETDNADIIRVYDSLMKGSRNHLRAFVSALKTQTGEIYEPQYLDQATYDEIINTSRETGRTATSRGQSRGRR